MGTWYLNCRLYYNKILLTRLANHALLDEPHLCQYWQYRCDRQSVAMSTAKLQPCAACCVYTTMRCGVLLYCGILMLWLECHTFVKLASSLGRLEWCFSVFHPRHMHVQSCCIDCDCHSCWSLCREGEVSTGGMLTEKVSFNIIEGGAWESSLSSHYKNRCEEVTLKQPHHDDECTLKLKDLKWRRWRSITASACIQTSEQLRLVWSWPKLWLSAT